MNGEGLLELLVEGAWVVDTLRALGSGHMLHLSFETEQVEPETLSVLDSGRIGPGALGEILAMGQTLKRVATFELQKVNMFHNYIRLDFRLLSVAPFIRNGERGDGRRYRCYFRSNGS